MIEGVFVFGNDRIARITKDLYSELPFSPTVETTMFCFFYHNIEEG